MNSDYDAIIAGAGPAGSTAAILLASAGWSVALIEKQSFPRRKVCGECICASNLPLLSALGVGDAFAGLAGPELREIAFYCGDRKTEAPFPQLPRERHPWGRALGRERFDQLLLARAREIGVHVWQPWNLRAVHGSAGAFCCRIDSRPAPRHVQLRAPILIMANGSWEGDPGGDRRFAKSPGDLFAFKANFSDSKLSPGVLPVISFAGGYGGVVIAEGGRLTFAGCIRRDALKACRAVASGRTAGEAFEYYVRTQTGALRDVLAGARREGSWLGIGPIRPGMRAPWYRSDGRFLVGNAAAEAHPIIGEGISMAMQSAWLLCVRLITAGGAHGSRKILQRIGTAYASDWSRIFAPRLLLAAILAHLAMRPWLAPIAWPIIGRAPTLLTRLARGAGKARAAPAFKELLSTGGFESLGDAN